MPIEMHKLQNKKEENTAKPPLVNLPIKLHVNIIDKKSPNIPSQI